MTICFSSTDLIVEYGHLFLVNVAILWHGGKYEQTVSISFTW